MKQLGIAEREQANIMKLLVALLNLGNITFSQDEAEKGICLIFFFISFDFLFSFLYFVREAFIDEDDTLDPAMVIEDCPKNEAFMVAAELLEQDPSALCTALTLRSMRGSTMKSSFYYIPFSRVQAQENRDTLCKTIYQLVFQWIINRMNLELEVSLPFLFVPYLLVSLYPCELLRFILVSLYSFSSPRVHLPITWGYWISLDLRSLTKTALSNSASIIATKGSRTFSTRTSSSMSSGSASAKGSSSSPCHLPITRSASP